MGESSDTPLKLQFDRRVRLDFRGATITSDAGLLACRELDAALGLTETANDYIHENRTGRNVQHPLLPLLRQSVYSRLAGYEDTNDAERLAQDPAMRVIVGWQGTDKQAASTNTMSRFETEVLTEEENLDGLARLNVEWVDRAMAQVRLWLFVLAYNLGNVMRRLTLPESVKHWSLRSVQTKLIKMGGRLVRHARRLVFQLAEVAVSREVFRQLLERIAGLHPAPG